MLYLPNDSSRTAPALRFLGFTLKCFNSSSDSPYQPRRSNLKPRRRLPIGEVPPGVGHHANAAQYGSNLVRIAARSSERFLHVGHYRHAPAPARGSR